MTSLKMECRMLRRECLLLNAEIFNGESVTGDMQL